MSSALWTGTKLSKITHTHTHTSLLVTADFQQTQNTDTHTHIISIHIDKNKILLPNRLGLFMLAATPAHLRGVQ